MILSYNTSMDGRLLSVVIVNSHVISFKQVGDHFLERSRWMMDGFRSTCWSTHLSIDIENRSLYDGTEHRWWSSNECQTHRIAAFLSTICKNFFFDKMPKMKLNRTLPLPPPHHHYRDWTMCVFYLILCSLHLSDLLRACALVPIFESVFDEIWFTMKMQSMPSEPKLNDSTNNSKMTESQEKVTSLPIKKLSLTAFDTDQIDVGSLHSGSDDSISLMNKSIEEASLIERFKDVSAHELVDVLEDRDTASTFIDVENNTEITIHSIEQKQLIYFEKIVLNRIDIMSNQLNTMSKRVSHFHFSPSDISFVLDRSFDQHRFHTYIKNNQFSRWSIY